MKTNHILNQSRKLIIQQPYTRHIVKWDRLSKAETRVMRAWLTQNKIAGVATIVSFLFKTFRSIDFQ